VAASSERSERSREVDSGRQQFWESGRLKVRVFTLRFDVPSGGFVDEALQRFGKRR